MNTTIFVNRPVTPLNIHYSLEIDGVQLGIFERITGGNEEIDVIMHNVVYASGEFATLNIPGPRKTTPITLECGFGNTAALYAWFEQVAEGDVFGARKNATISLNSHIGGKYQPVVLWHLINVWPSKVDGFNLNQFSTDWARFSITLVCESIEREDVKPAAN
jgi:phage tail-like protein